MSEPDHDDARPQQPDILVIGPGGRGRGRRWSLPIAALAAVVAIAGGSYAATRGSQPALDQARPAASVTQLVHGAATATEHAKSSKFAMTMDMQVAGQSIAMNGDGAFDYRTDIGTFSMSIPSFGQMQMVMVPGTLYMKMSGALAQGMPGHKPWVRIDLDKLGALSGVNLQSLIDQAQQQNPVENLRVLTEAAGIKKVGRETVRGASTTHYAGQVTFADLAKFYKGQLADQLDKLGGQIASQPIPIDVWIDDDGLPRRLVESIAIPNMMMMRLSMDLFDFGTPVHVTPPSDDEVTDLSSMLTPSA